MYFAADIFCNVFDIFWLKLFRPILVIIFASSESVLKNAPRIAIELAAKVAVKVAAKVAAENVVDS